MSWNLLSKHLKEGNQLSETLTCYLCGNKISVDTLLAYSIKETINPRDMACLTGICVELLISLTDNNSIPTNKFNPFNI